MPDPLTVALVAKGLGEGTQAFLDKRNQSRAESADERREALRRLLEALSGQAQAATQSTQAQRGVGGTLLAEGNRQLDPLVQQVLANLFRGGGGSGV